MELKLENKEPLWILFGMPLCTGLIIGVTVLIARWSTAEPPSPETDVHLTAELKVPENFVNVTVPVPPAEIHNHTEVIKERTVPPEKLEVRLNPVLQVGPVTLEGAHSTPAQAQEQPQKRDLRPTLVKDASVPVDAPINNYGEILPGPKK